MGVEDSKLNWLTDLIKHISVTNKVAFALFCTSAVLLFGPIAYPAIIDINLDMIWRMAAWAVLAYSASLLVILLCEQVILVLRTSVKLISHLWCGRKISEEEQIVLAFLGEKANRPTNMATDLENLMGVKKLRFLKTISSLKKKGLVEVSRHDEEIVWLTKWGRSKAMHYLVVLKQNNNNV